MDFSMTPARAFSKGGLLLHYRAGGAADADLNRARVGALKFRAAGGARDDAGWLRYLRVGVVVPAMAARRRGARARVRHVEQVLHVARFVREIDVDLVVVGGLARGGFGHREVTGEPAFADLVEGATEVVLQVARGVDDERLAGAARSGDVVQGGLGSGVLGPDDANHEGRDGRVALLAAGREVGDGIYLSLREHRLANLILRLEGRHAVGCE